MPKRIPVSIAAQVGKSQDCRQVILLAWDGERTHIVTWGKTAEDCSQAADGGNALKQKWGWPECNEQPSRVEKLQAEVASWKSKYELQARLARQFTSECLYCKRGLPRKDGVHFGPEGSSLEAQALGPCRAVQSPEEAAR